MSTELVEVKRCLGVWRVADSNERVELLSLQKSKIELNDDGMTILACFQILSGAKES